jgi:hypothetical protein
MGSGIATPAAFLRVVESAEFAVTFGAAANFTHGLPGAPRGAQAVLRCKTAELGYSVGDEVPLPAAVGGGINGTLSLNANGTSITVSICAGGYIQVCRKDTFANQAITAASWRLVVRAWR